MAKNQHQPIQALSAGDHLQNHNLAEFAGILAQQACAGFTGHAGTLGRANAGENGRKARAQQCQSQTAPAAKESTALLQFKHLSQFSHNRVPPKN